MRKSIISLLFALLFIPFVVNAKEYCKVVNGDGKSIGSEIACGTEHFYIVDSDGNEIKMLAKYNLYTGISIHKEKLSDGQTCEELASSKGGTVKSDDFYNAPGYCFYIERIETDKIVQSEEAKSAHQDSDGNYLYPQVGDVYPFWSPTGNMADSFFLYDLSFRTEYNQNQGYQIIGDEKYDGLFADALINFSPMRSQSSVNYGEIYNELGGSLYSYYNEMINNGFNVNKMDLLSLDDLNKLAKKNGKAIPYAEWNENVERMIEQNGHQTPQLQYGVLKDYLKTNWKWVYDRTYWLKTMSGSTSYYYGQNTLLFVDNFGDVCGAPGYGSRADMGCMQLVKTAIGAGIRPVITISANELQYLIKTKTDGNGTIDVVDNALGNDTVQFKITSKNGYKLNSIVITTDNGEKVEFSEGELINNSDGTVSIDKNKFTMPFENVTIVAKWGILNPKTGDIIFIIISLIIACLGIGTIINKRKESRKAI